MNQGVIAKNIFLEFTVDIQRGQLYKKTFSLEFFPKFTSQNAENIRNFCPRTRANGNCIFYFFGGEMTVQNLRRSVSFTILMIALLFGVRSANTQAGLAVVEGTVNDASGAVVTNAKVVLTNTASGDALTVTTGSDGRYTFPTVSPGTYSVSVKASTFSTKVISGLTLVLGQHLEEPVTLTTGSETTTVAVTAEVPDVDTEAYDTGGLVDQEQINNLPIQNRQYLGLALLTPGTTQAASRSFYSNVQSGGGIYFYSNGFSWDGVSNQQTEEGDPRQNIPEDAVGEFKTYTSQMPVDLGWTMGGYTTLVTKSGTNNIHGDAFEYYRNTGMTALNQFQAATAVTQGNSGPIYNRHQFGGSAGGPIFKNRTHYYGAYERTQATTSWTLFEPAGSAAATDYASLLGTFQNPSHDQLIVGRVDHDLKPNQQLFFRVAFEEQLATAQGCGGTTTTGCYDGQFPRKAYVAGHTWEPTTHIVNEFRFQYAYISYELGPWNTPPPKVPSDFLNPSYSKNVTLSFAFPSLSYGHNYAADGVESRWQANDGVTFIKGAHAIKVGVDASYVPYTDASASNLNGTYTWQVDEPFDNTAATESTYCTTPGASNCPHSFSQAAVPLLYYLPSTQQAYYVEDSWKMKKNFTASYGLRWERQTGSAFLDTYTPNSAKPTIPFEGNPHTRGDKRNFGPRLGVSWDPLGKGRDVVRGGYGIFYQFIETELTEAEKLNFVACSIALTNGTAPAGTPPNDYLPYPNPYNGQTVGTYCGATANTGVTIMSPNLRNAYANQFTIGYSRQLGQDLALSVDGIYDRGLRDYKVYDLNIPSNYVGISIPRPNTQMASINQHASTGASEYKGLFVKLDKRYSKRYMYTVAYALSSALDNNPHSAPVNYLAQQNDWGQSGVDQRNALVVSGSYMLPWKIMVGGIFQYRSRSPYSVTTTQITADAPVSGTVNDGFGVLPYNPNYNGTAQYIPGTTRDQGNRGINWAAVNLYRTQLNTHQPAAGYKPTTYYTACAANANNCLTTNLSDASVTSNRYKDFDLRVSKTFTIHDNLKVDAIGQAFDLFGTENYSSIQYSPLVNTFGQPTNAGTVQIGEIAVKITF
jgi:hypothetical protein